MNSSVPRAEDLPALYRAILDAVADLERRGRRVDARRIRSEATAAYSSSWDEAGRRRLEQLHAQAWRLIAGSEEHQARRIGWRRPARAASTTNS
jgi:hypothetical protein